MAIIDQTVNGILKLKRASKEVESDQVDFIEAVYIECPITHFDFNLV